MAFKKRNLKIAVTTMALISVISSSTIGVKSVYAGSNTNNIAVERTLENQNYTVKNKIEYIKNGQVSTDGYEKLRAALSEDTLIEVINNKIYMTLEFATPEQGDQYSMIDNIAITVDGKTTNFTKTDDRKYTVELGSLDSAIQLTYDVNIPIPNMPPHSFTMNVLLGSLELEEKNEAPVISASDVSISVGDKFDAKSLATANDKEEGDLTKNIKVISDNVNTNKAGTYSVTYEVSDSKGLTTTKTITVKVLEKSVAKPSKLEDGTYKIKNKTIYTGNSSMGSSMVRNSLKEISYLEVKDGQVYATLEFDKSLSEYMKNIKISVDGKAVTTTDNNGKVTFKVASIDSKIDVSAYITAMGMNINYTVALDESTLEKTSSSNNGGTSGSTTGNSTSNNGGTSGSTTGNSSSNNSGTSGSTSTESTVKKGKLYTIQNTVSHESEAGRQMARKYLNSTSKVEEIDGKYYVTLTFTGSEFMKNHAIYVNGSKVSHTVAAKSGDSISLRFRVSSLSDTIKVGMYVVPMSRNIDFTVKLLQNTLKFVKEYELTSENGGVLPQTGSAIDTTMMMGAGSALIAAGEILRRRKK